ncbi:ATP-binding protein [Tissierella sp.]|uniref:ATP-binding protein n=1 Tax=Tissierella sp. TaxID=41274 RepID=UPI002858A29B|nr:ATP-binding protein [Tissierella sp.]MDR7857278.1 ATP-binding protein [Tissierella sp.]
MKKSIKTRLVKSFMLIILITVVILEVVLINGVKDYYYKNVEDILSSQIEFSIGYYLRYFSSETLEDIVIDDVDVFWQHTNAQVQILNSDGKLLMDSLGANNDDTRLLPDITKAINGEKGVWRGTVDYYEDPVMSVSMPIKDQDRVIGIIRFITSLHETNHIIWSISLILLWIGIIVVLFSGMVSILIANSIVKPLQEVTKVAEKMADGQLKVRSDITLQDEIGKLSNTLNYMAEELIKKEQIKNDFISSVSHELRTPLTSIKGWAVTLKSEDLQGNEIILDGLDIIEKESDRLSIMVEELLDFSKFVSGRINLEKDVFQVRDTIEMIGKQLTPRAVNNKINFIKKIDQDLGYMVGDENRIKQVLINLLDNAFKFTSEGGEVVLNAYKEDDILTLEVIDNGSGISEDDLPKVVEKFYKGKDSKSHSGIGLSICDEIVKLHNGSMEILSNINEGTTVIVKFPLKEANI